MIIIKLKLIRKLKIKENKNIESINKNINVVLQEFYDIIINIKSVKDISKGWEIKMTQKGEENFNKYKNSELIKIGVIGNSNKGKSFILSRISRIKLPSGTSIKTEGLSIKYPELEELKMNKIALLDSAGLETPVLIEDEENEKQKNEVENDNNKEEYKQNEDEINKINDDNDVSEIKDDKTNMSGENDIECIKEKKNENENRERINKELFKEKSREKLITELFLQNYIINNSDIIILVVGILTYSEQKLLNRIKTEIQKLKMKKNLFVLHNLKTFYTINQVKNHIENNLKKSATFILKEGHKITPDTEEKKGTYFFEIDSDPKIFHLIFANEGSEAGDYYNNFTIKFIENYYQNITDLKSFDVFETIKQRFINLSKEIIEKNNENKNFDIIFDKKAIKLQTPQKIILKRCFIDELGFSNLKGNGFEPNFNYYKKDNKIIVRLEAPGNSTLDYDLEYSGEYTIIRLKGTKKPDKEPENHEDIIHTNREFGDFNLEIPLKTEDYNISDENVQLVQKKGIFILEFEFRKKAKKTELKVIEVDI